MKDVRPVPELYLVCLLCLVVSLSLALDEQPRSRVGKDSRREKGAIGSWAFRGVRGLAMVGWELFQLPIQSEGYLAKSWSSFAGAHEAQEAQRGSGDSN